MGAKKNVKIKSKTVVQPKITRVKTAVKKLEYNSSAPIKQNKVRTAEGWKRCMIKAKQERMARTKPKH